jgi:hypothetical protein
LELAKQSDFLFQVLKDERLASFDSEWPLSVENEADEAWHSSQPSLFDSYQQLR